MKRYIIAILLLIFCNISFAQNPGRGHGNHGVGNGKGKGNWKHHGNKHYKYKNGRYYYNYDNHRYYRTPLGVVVKVK
jgi:hypothetical protein